MGDALHLQDIVLRAAVRRERYVDLRFGPYALNALNPRQCLLAALDECRLAILRAKALDEPLLARDLALLSSCRSVLLLQARGLLSLVFAVVAGVALDGPLTQFDDPRGDAVEKFAVVGNHQDCPAVVA